MSTGCRTSSLSASDPVPDQLYQQRTWYHAPHLVNRPNGLQNPLSRERHVFVLFRVLILACNVHMSRDELIYPIGLARRRELSALRKGDYHIQALLLFEFTLGW